MIWGYRQLWKGSCERLPKHTTNQKCIQYQKCIELGSSTGTTPDENKVYKISDGTTTTKKKASKF